ncbi:anthrone oxygenase family protein [Foetidibacter luteolus]|uniref:anthrone oxygenase family protein n=1 Tax=Foetidibacter luteolus TaxID=2608880 RepID=UPI00129B2324|nr:anthrone oxygenase family protein [Foetidibacter luteolus]
MQVFYNVTLLSNVILSGLVAGLFYAYSCSVNIGLGNLPDAEYLRAMQSINRAILNPWFFTSFMGALILLPVNVWLAFKSNANTGAIILLFLSLAVYGIFVFGITAGGNVPLNEALDKLDISTLTTEHAATQRKAFEIPWNNYHFIRTIASVATFILTAVACFKYR